MNTIAIPNFYELSNSEMYCFEGGRWTWASTCDVIVAVGCVALGCTGPAGVVLSACISVGYTVGRGF